MTHMWVGKVTIIGSENGLSPGRRHAIIWTIAGILLIEHLETNFSEILIKINTFLFTKMYLKMSSGKWRPFCLGLNVSTRTARESFVEIHSNTLQNGSDYIAPATVSEVTLKNMGKWVPRLLLLESK